ncbi:MAG TPA: phosphate ABC transporter permease PstA [Thermoanaerobaculia bacterium]|nr:phosphate ABC transporter permease PstA [Thermoanaerobaculia bacterium]
MRAEDLRARGRRDLLGRALTWLCGGALAVNLLLVVGILALLGAHGLAFFWQKPLLWLELDDGRRLLGEVWERNEIPAAYDAAPGRPEGGAEGSWGTRIRLKVGNRDVTGADFVWLDEPRVVRSLEPRDAVVLERLEWGNFYGFPSALRRGGETLAAGREETWRALQPALAAKAAERAAAEAVEDEVSDVNYRIERLRLDARKVELADLPPEARARRLAAVEAELGPLQARYDELAAELFARREALLAERLVMATAAGSEAEVAVGEIVRAIRPNALGLAGKLALYLSRAWELLAADPRESNTEGGIFPAIFGTVMMVFLMSFAVAPLGVLAALYLREYARQGALVRIVRIAVNNLAGVPSIVFGVFGLGFFVYVLGGTIDQLFYRERLPAPTYGTGGILWAALTLAILTVPVVIVAAEEGLAAVPRVVREGSLALGATKFETLWRVVVPAAAPGILTGMILAMARAAGEVAPLMIVGMVKLAPSLPIDGHFPFLHPERKFMHLGFHIYDVGFQSPNVEATKPLVFATALLLVVLVVLMNLVAISLRNHLRRKYAGAAV